MALRRSFVVVALLGLVLGACSLGSSSEVASTGRQAVDAAPGRSLTSVVARAPVEPLPEVVPADAVVPPGSVPDALAFKGEAAASVSAGVEASSTTSTTVVATTGPTTPRSVAPSTTVETEQDPVVDSTTTTVAPDPVPVVTSSCPAPVFDNGSLGSSVRAVGPVDDDGVDDVVVIGLDDDREIRVVVDFGDGGQSGVGTLASFGEFGSPFVVEFTGNVDRPLRVHRGSESVLVWVEDCVPLRAANG